MLALTALASVSCAKKSSKNEISPVTIDYWEKWTGFEADAMRAVVDNYNAGQRRVHVNYSSTSQMDRRLTLAISGGVPPDVAGIYGKLLPVYAENNALLPLDRMASQAGINPDRYIDVFWRICNYQNRLWALPTTPGCLALIWNKKLFREAGLDPEQPPRSISELDQFAARMVKRRPDGGLQACGYLPAEPGWWPEIWGWWFGGRLWDGDRTITADSPENLAAYEWVASYPRRLGADRLLAFRDASANFASPQNAFFNGRVAMILQGPWIYNFIKNFAPPDFEWGVAPFPSVDPQRLGDVTLVETDALVIPAGSKHPKEAFDFISYVNEQAPMEKLCLGQRKFSPLKQCTPDFFTRHPNPYINKFLELAKSPNAHFLPQITSWASYSNDMTQAFDLVWSGKAEAQSALQNVERHEQAAFDKQLERWNRLSAQPSSKRNEP